MCSRSFFAAPLDLSWPRPAVSSGSGLVSRSKIANSASVSVLSNGALLFAGQLVADGLQSAEELLEIVGAGVVLIDQATEPLGQVQPGRVLARRFGEPLLQVLRRWTLAAVRLLVAKLQGELFEVESG